MAVHLNSSGITMPATQSVSGDANTMDDYEEGTWTVTYSFQNSTQESNKAFTVQEGGYCKVGQLCLVEARVFGTYSGGTQDNVNTDLPFTHTAHFASSVGGPHVIMSGNGQNFNASAMYVHDNNATGTLCGTYGTGNYSQSMPTTYTSYFMFSYRSSH